MIWEIIRQRLGIFRNSVLIRHGATPRNRSFSSDFHVVVPREFFTDDDVITMVEPLKEVGDRVEADESIAAVELDCMVTVDVPSPEAGIIKKFELKEGDIVEVGDTIAVISKSAD